MLHAIDYCVWIGHGINFKITSSRDASHERVYGLERWNGMVEWTGLDWNGMEWNGQICMP